jgi:hypothetical protein
MSALDTEFCPNRCKIWQRDLFLQGGMNMASRRTEVAIEKIIASCDGNMHGALEALMLVNEHLEGELHRLYSVISRMGQADEECFETVH